VTIDQSTQDGKKNWVAQQKKREILAAADSQVLAL